jgi:tetratricopeptide (TPR) repeat protein
VVAYRLALAALPEDRDAWQGLLRAQVASGDGEGALETLDELEARHRSVDPCPALALVVAERLERGGDAGTPARRSVDAGCGGSARQLARVLARQSDATAPEDPAAAILQLERAIELDPQEPTYFRSAAELLLAQERTREAIALLATGLEHHPEDRPLRELMVRALSIR